MHKDQSAFREESNINAAVSVQLWFDSWHVDFSLYLSQSYIQWAEIMVVCVFQD